MTRSQSFFCAQLCAVLLLNVLIYRVQYTHAQGACKPNHKLLDQCKTNDREVVLYTKTGREVTTFSSCKAVRKGTKVAIETREVDCDEVGQPCNSINNCQAYCFGFSDCEAVQYEEDVLCALLVLSIDTNIGDNVADYAGTCRSAVDNWDPELCANTALADARCTHTAVEETYSQCSCLGDPGLFSCFVQQTNAEIDIEVSRVCSLADNPTRSPSKGPTHTPSNAPTNTPIVVEDSTPKPTPSPTDTPTATTSAPTKALPPGETFAPIHLPTAAPSLESSEADEGLFGLGEGAFVGVAGSIGMLTILFVFVAFRTQKQRRVTGVKTTKKHNSLPESFNPALSKQQEGTGVDYTTKPKVLASLQTWRKSRASDSASSGSNKGDSKSIMTGWLRKKKSNNNNKDSRKPAAMSSNSSQRFFDSTVSDNNVATVVGPVLVKKKIQTTRGDKLNRQNSRKLTTKESMNSDAMRIAASEEAKDKVGTLRGAMGRADTSHNKPNRFKPFSMGKFAAATSVRQPIVSKALLNPLQTNELREFLREKDVKITSSRQLEKKIEVLAGRYRRQSLARALFKIYKSVPPSLEQFIEPPM